MADETHRPFMDVAAPRTGTQPACAAPETGRRKAGLLSGPASHGSVRPAPRPALSDFDQACLIPGSTELRYIRAYTSGGIRVSATETTVVLNNLPPRRPDDTFHTGTVTRVQQATVPRPGQRPWLAGAGVPAAPLGVYPTAVRLSTAPPVPASPPCNRFKGRIARKMGAVMVVEITARVTRAA